MSRYRNQQQEAARIEGLDCVRVTRAARKRSGHQASALGSPAGYRPKTGIRTDGGRPRSHEFVKFRDGPALRREEKFGEDSVRREGDGHLPIGPKSSHNFKIMNSQQFQACAAPSRYRLPAIIWAACCMLVSVTVAPDSMRATSWVRARSSSRRIWVLVRPSDSRLSIRKC